MYPKKVIYLFFFILLCAQTIRFVCIFSDFLYQIEKYFVNLHPQTESPRCKGGEVAYIWKAYIRLFE